MAGFVDILRNRNFLLLWIGQVISRFGDRLNQMALIALISTRAPGSTFELAKLLSFTIVPVFIIGPFAGVYVDRLNRKYTMVISDILRGLLVLLIPLSFIYWDNIFPIYIVVFLIFSITRFFLTSQLSIIPSIVSSDKLLLANSLNSITRIVATIISFGIGGILVAWVGTRGGFYIDAVTYFISATMIAFIIFAPKVYEFDKEIEKERKPTSVFRQIKEGIKYLVYHKELHFTIGIMFSLMAGAGIMYTVMIVFIQETLGSVTKDLGFLAMFAGIGLLLGALLFGRLGQKLRREKVMFCSLIFTGFSIILFSVIVNYFKNFFVAAITTVLIGLSMSPIIISVQTFIHELVPNNIRGRVFSSLEIIIHIAFVIFMILGSFLADHIGPLYILVGTGILLIILGISSFWYFKKYYF